jgi:hypothetical protein
MTVQDRRFIDGAPPGDLVDHLQPLCAAGALGHDAVILVDHALSRAFDKGAIGQIIIEGEPNPEIFQAFEPEDAGEVASDPTHDNDLAADDVTVVIAARLLDATAA